VITVAYARVRRDARRAPRSTRVAGATPTRERHFAVFRVRPPTRVAHENPKAKPTTTPTTTLSNGQIRGDPTPKLGARRWYETRKQQTELPRAPLEREPCHGGVRSTPY